MINNCFCTPLRPDSSFKGRTRENKAEHNAKNYIAAGASLLVPGTGQLIQGNPKQGLINFGLFASFTTL